MYQADIQNAIETGRTALAIEFGSTRIKAVLICEDHMPLASGSHEWENLYENGIWTYRLEDVWTGLQESYRRLKCLPKRIGDGSLVFIMLVTSFH